MNLSLRRFEAVVILVTFAVLCVLVLVALLWNGSVGSVWPQLIPQPNVTNQKEATLNSLKDEKAAATPEAQKLKTLQQLKASGAAAPSPSPTQQQKLDVLRNLSSQ